MRFYVAGKWGDRVRVKALMDELVFLGHEITKDWTIDEEDTPGFPIINVVEDMRGIQQADAYVGRFITNHDYKGALVEMGAALVVRNRVFIIGHAIDSCIFIKHPLVQQFDNEDEFLSFVSDINKRRGKWLT